MTYSVTSAYWDSKWTRLRKIAPACWTRTPGPLRELVIARLGEQWCQHFFDGAVASLAMLTEAASQAPLAIVFQTADGLYDVRLFSRVAPGNYYDFFWDFAPLGPLVLVSPDTSGRIPVTAGHAQARAVKIQRWGPHGVAGVANAVWRADPPLGPVPPEARLIRVFCEELDETIDLNLATLAIQMKESQVQKSANLEPWRRLLQWMGSVRAVDSEAHGRLPAAIRTYLANLRAPAQLAALTEAQIVTWQRQGLLPTALPLIYPSDLAIGRDSVARQQGLARSSEVLMLFNNANPFPKLLMGLNSATLELVDIQSLMTIGALQELHGFLELERQRILARRPDLQTLLHTPQGLRRLEEDAEIIALKSHPEAIREQMDLNDIAMRRAGNFGPTARDMQAATLQFAQASELQMLSMMNPIAGVIGAMQATKANNAVGGRPWKIYKPYLC